MTPENAEKLAQLWTASQPEVAAFVGSLIVDHEQARDVLQQVAVQLVRSFDHYDPTRPFVAWAIGVAKNEVLAHRRKAATDRHVFDDALAERVADSYQQMVNDDGPIERALRECMEKVDDRGRQAIDLYYGRSLKSPAIGKEMSLTPTAVRKLLCRTREAIRKCIQQRLGREEVDDG